MKVEIAKSAGFCFGVKRAVNMVYQALENNTLPIYTYGPIIHNDEVVRDMEEKGAVVINDLNRLDSLEKGIIILRSHGISRHEQEIMEKSGNRILNATCPFVLKIHKHVKEYSARGYHIVIIGNPNHPEVKGIRGWVENPAEVTVIKDYDDAGNLCLDRDKKICIVSQTTFNYNKFKDLVEIISKKGYDILVLNTICSATEERQTEARKIASESEAMIVIGDQNSSNTQKLFEICKNECENTYYIQTSNDMDYSKLQSINNVGITAGASTPNNIIEEVSKNVRNEL